MLALGAAAGRRDTALARAVLHPSAVDTESVASGCPSWRALGRRPPEALDPALEVLFGVAPNAVGRSLEQALGTRVAANPRDVGALVALGRVAERRSDAGIARAAYSVLWIVDPEFPWQPPGGAGCRWRHQARGLLAGRPGPSAGARAAAADVAGAGPPAGRLRSDLLAQPGGWDGPGSSWR